MALIVNLRHLENRALELRGELSVAELDLDVRDELIRVTGPVAYDLEVELLDDALLVQGEVRVDLACECVRCLKPFTHRLDLADWMVHLPLVPLADEPAVPVKHDCVDLTPWLREDILLGFPQHPLCRPDCGGLKPAAVGRARKTVGNVESKPSAWAELNKLKL